MATDQSGRQVRWGNTVCLGGLVWAASSRPDSRPNAIAIAIAIAIRWASERVVVAVNYSERFRSLIWTLVRIN